MDEPIENINTEAFLPAAIQNKNKSKKRAISEDDKMIVDDDTGIEGSTKKNVPKSKRKKFSNAEFRKIAVPAHRLVTFCSDFVIPHFMDLFTTTDTQR